MTNNGTMGSLHRGFWNGPLLASFSFILSLFQTNNTIFTTICEKCPSSIPCWDSNPRSLDRKSPPVSTRPGLPPCMHWGSLEEHSQFLSLEAFFSGPSFKSKHFFHISIWSRLFWCEKFRVCSNVFWQNTTRLFSINSCQVRIKPFVCAGQASTLRRTSMVVNTPPRLKSVLKSTYWSLPASMTGC